MANINLGTNIEGSLDGNILTIKIDLSKTFGKSASGKSITIATTGGNQKIAGTDAVAGVNVYKKA